MRKEEVKAIARRIRSSLLTNRGKVEEDLNKKWESSAEKEEVDSILARKAKLEEDSEKLCGYSTSYLASTMKNNFIRKQVPNVPDVEDIMDDIIILSMSEEDVASIVNKITEKYL